jgi:translation initiation factor 6
MTIVRTDFEGDVNVGAFGSITDKFVFTSPNMSEKSMNTIERTFNLPLIQATVATTDIVGIMSVSNSNGILVPYTTTDDELEIIKRSSDVKVDWIESKMTALGNIILANDNGAICHPEFDANARRKITDVLDVEVVQGTIAKLPIVGASTLATSKGAIIHPMATDDEISQVAQMLKVDVEVGTINRGSPYTRLGVLANMDGMIAGSDTTGVELAHVSQVLGFI